MSQPTLKNQINNFLEQFGRRGDGRRYSIEDLRKEAGISRTTLNNWNRHVAKPTVENIKRLAAGMHDLSARINRESSTPEEVIPLEKCQKMAQAWFQEHDAREPKLDIFFITYPPICDQPRGEDPRYDETDSAGSTFFGTLWAEFSTIQSQRFNATQDRNAISEFDIEQPDVIVGLFPTYEREGWCNFIRSPIQICTSALVLRRDIQPFLGRITAMQKTSRRTPDADEYLGDLTDALWRYPASDDRPLSDIQAAVRNDISWISAREEIGREYLEKALRFTTGEIEANEPSNSDEEVGNAAHRQNSNAVSFFSTLRDKSDAFNRDLERGAGADTHLKLPALIADEITVLDVAIQMRNDLDLDAVALRPSGKQLLRPGYDMRPRYSPSIGIRRETAKSGPAINNLYEVTRNSFDEFLWSNVGFVSREYFRLYKTLVKKYDWVLGTIAPLYILKWLSIELDPARITDAAGNVTALDFQRNRRCAAAWDDILNTTAEMIIDDDQLKRRLAISLHALSAEIGLDTSATRTERG